MTLLNTYIAKRASQAKKQKQIEGLGKDRSKNKGALSELAEEIKKMPPVMLRSGDSHSSMEITPRPARRIYTYLDEWYDEFLEKRSSINSLFKSRRSLLNR